MFTEPGILTLVRVSHIAHRLSRRFEVHEFAFPISAQPTDSTCGPTCLHSVYEYFDDQISLETVISETGRFEDGGTLAVFLACHALKRGYKAKIYTYNLQVFDPTWFLNDQIDLSEKLESQLKVKSSPKLHAASHAYIEFLRLGGVLRMEVLNINLIRRYLKRRIPILTGLSATFLFGESRERCLEVPEGKISVVADDIGGYPAGHFVVLCGYDKSRQTVLVADPLDPNPFAKDHQYAVDIDRVFSAIMLGVVTYDANLLVIQPSDTKCETMDAHADRQ